MARIVILRRILDKATILASVVAGVETNTTMQTTCKIQMLLEATAWVASAIRRAGMTTMAGVHGRATMDGVMKAAAGVAGVITTFMVTLMEAWVRATTYTTNQTTANVTNPMVAPVATVEIKDALLASMVDTAVVPAGAVRGQLSL